MSNNIKIENFDICEDTAIAIYGLGNIGQHKCEELVNMGYQVVGIIDRNAESLSPYCGIEVYTIDKFAKMFTERDEIVIAICLNNGMQHEKTAYVLSEYGYKKFLYIPMDANMDYEYLEKMQKSYSLFMENRFSELKEVPVFARMDVDKQDDIQVISRGSGNIVFLCEIEYLFSQNMSILKKDVEYIYKKRLKDNTYVDKPVASVRIYKDLYDFFMGKNAYPDIYMQHQGKEMSDNHKLLCDRAELFEYYEKRYNTDIRLFYMQPTTVIWNEKGYFNVIDGMHRLMYLYYVKNHFKVPVKTSKESFDMFRCSYRSKRYLYKSVTLVFQELLLPKHLGGRGAIVSERTLDLEQQLLNTGGGYIAFKNIGDIPRNMKYDWLYYKMEYEKCFNEQIERLSMYSSSIVIECTDDFLEESIKSDCFRIVNKGEVLTKKMKRRVFYLLQYKTN